jgi:hypothetical protein
MPQVGFEITIPVFERAKAVHALARPVFTAFQRNTPCYIEEVRTLLYSHIGEVSRHNSQVGIFKGALYEQFLFREIGSADWTGRCGPSLKQPRDATCCRDAHPESSGGLYINKTNDQQRS